PLTSAPLFFSSSRRRHTISKRDWSSDVCSSDLVSPPFGTKALCPPLNPSRILSCFCSFSRKSAQVIFAVRKVCYNKYKSIPPIEIGRASCRKEGRQAGANESELRGGHTGGTVGG